MGYHQAGFDVVGVDIRPQPNYPFEFIGANALEYARYVDERDFDAIHASPPCQAYTRSRQIRGNEHPDLLGPTRELLEETGLPWVIENVPGAPMRPDYRLCGCMFGLAPNYRPRWFECSWHPYELIQPCHHPILAKRADGKSGTVFGHNLPAEETRRLMQMPWASRDECGQAIPPPMTEFIGHRLLQQLAHTQKAACAER